ncbi:LD-carboxypeptidase, partial [Candidatus Dojkabacteria bacterium]|nr:LD-carboxypeptidase [Candidatus Dojkabacteria bacterium]
MKYNFPTKLKKGDKVAIIAPARSMHIINNATRANAKEHFQQLGLELVFGNNVEEVDFFNSASIEKRVDDIHWAFSDPDISAIFTVIGGFNSNQLLDYIDWDLIKANPKVFCGFSDITILNNSIYAKTGLVNYYGPHYSTLGQKFELEYTLKFLRQAVIENDDIEVVPSDNWTDDEWWMDQENRALIKNEGYWTIHEGEAEGKILGGNVGTFNLLHGTQYMPDISDSILFIEDDSESQ